MKLATPLQQLRGNLKRSLSPPWVPANQGLAPYFWLLAFGVFAWKYAYVMPELQELMLITFTFALFIPLYFYSFWIDDWRIYVCISASCLLGFLWAPYNFGGSCFLIFAATMCSRFPDIRVAYRTLATIVIILAGISLIFTFNPFFSIPALIFSITSGVGSIMGQRLHRSNENLSRKQEEVELLATIAERERIGRDLHDLLGHTLSIITLKAELARKLFDRDAEACKQELSDIEQTARSALAEVRAAVLGFRATGLTHEIQCAQRALAAAQVKLTIHLENFVMPAAIENVIALALREAITNIVRHAKASNCELRIFADTSHACLHISDDGCAGISEKNFAKGNGLTGMTERVQAIGGELILRAEQGMHLEIRLPMGVQT
jgi:two-component system sensor histidine kinase DesK